MLSKCSKWIAEFWVKEEEEDVYNTKGKFMFGENDINGLKIFLSKSLHSDKENQLWHKR